MEDVIEFVSFLSSPKVRIGGSRMGRHMHINGEIRVREAARALLARIGGERPEVLACGECWRRVEGQVNRLRQCFDGMGQKGQVMFLEALVDGQKVASLVGVDASENEGHRRQEVGQDSPWWNRN